MKPGPKDFLSVGFLYDDTLDSNDGVTQYVKTLGGWLSGRGHSVSYLVGETKTASWHGGKIYSLSKNLAVSWGGNRLSIPLIPKKRQIARVTEANAFDVIHVQVPYSPLMSQLVINRVCPETALIGTVHVFPSGWLSKTGSKLLRLLYGKSLKRFDEMLSVSGAAQSYAKEALKSDSQVIPNVVDVSVFKKQSSHNSGKSKKIVFLGRLVKRKGCKYLLLAFAQMHARLPDARLTVAGDGPEKKSLQALAKSLGIADSVVFLGRVSEAKKIELLSTADIACFPSLYGESFGIVLLEAMATGARVVLGGQNPGYSDVLGERKELLVEPRNSDQFAGRLEKLLSDKPLADELYKWQQNEVKKYDIETVGPNIEAVYRRAIAKRAKSRHN
ncbi:glycosyltransferase family 4 protein [Candidatus Saccharibacteria bacterium]|nr:glycosyltransferase family 4 protein [Candidatus Saccharibacteria bacterium]